MTDWQLGLQAFREGRMREAADRLQAALSENELSISQTVRYETCAFLGAALYALGLPAEALAAFQAARRLSPTPFLSVDLMMNLAHASLAAGQRDEARETLQALLKQAPGHVAAQMLAQRLDSSPASGGVTGVVLGVSPETAQRYIRTLTFTRASGTGYEPAEVKEALHQLERFIQGLSQGLTKAETKIAQLESEVQRYRQMEDAVVENMINQLSPPAQKDSAKSGLSPIELLFQQKP